MGDDAASNNARKRAISRRRFLAYLGAAAAAAGTGQLLVGGGVGTPAEAADEFPFKLFLPGLSKAPADTTAIFYLDPEHGAGQLACPIPHAGSRACHACNACHNHATNKMFASAEAADSGRAHFACKCLIYQVSATESEYKALFGASGQRVSFDKRKDQLFT